MPIGSALSAIVGGVASAGASRLLGGRQKFNPSPVGTGVRLQSPGFGFSNNTVGITADRQALTGKLSGVFSDRAQALKGLLGEVTPGFGRLTKSRLAQLSDARNRTVGDLKSSLERRKVLGSSFANDTITRAEGEFARAEDEIVATSFLQEIDISINLVNQISEAAALSFQTILDDQDAAANLGAQLITGTAAAISQNNATRAELAVQSARGAGKFFEPAITAVGKSASDTLAKIFERLGI